MEKKKKRLVKEDDLKVWEKEDSISRRRHYSYRDLLDVSQEFVTAPLRIQLIIRLK